MKFLKMFSFILLQATLFSAPWWAYSQPGTRALKCATETVTWSCPGTPITNPTSTTPQACIQQLQAGAAGNATVYAITVAVTGATGTVTYAWPTPEGPIQFVNSAGTQVLTGTQTGPTVWIRATTPIAVNNQNWGKARLKCEYSITGGPCGCKGFATLDLFKKINSTIFPVIGPTCVVPGTAYTYSVDPVFSRNVADGIGVDTYKWLLTGTGNINYPSGDGSSITYTFSGTGPWTIVETSGTTCNTTPAPTVNISAGPGQVTITNPNPNTTTGGYSYTNGQNSGSPASINWDFCLDNDKSTPITITPAAAGANTFSYICSGGTPATVTNSGGATVFTPNSGAAGTQMIVTVSASNSSNPTCGGSSATLKIHRRFSTVNTITKPTVANNCLIPGQSYQFSITGPVPANTLYSWSFPPATTGWSFVGSPGNTGTTVNCIVSSGASNISGPICRITNTGPSTCIYNVTPALPAFTVASPNGYKLKIDAQGGGSGNYVVANDPSIPVPTYSWLPGGTTRFNFNYQWWFSATSSTSGFSLFAQGCGVSSVTANQIGWMYCIVSPAGSTTGTCNGTAINQSTTQIPPLPNCVSAACTAASVCFSYQTPVVPVSPTQRPNPGVGDPIKLSNPLNRPRILVVPNPTDGKVQLDGEGFSEPGKIQLFGINGKIELEIHDFKPGAEIDLKALPKGLYKIRFSSPEGEDIQSVQRF